ncbi:hypothetical protein JCM16303_006341 [Sporobolomyces ruberrimus]
MAFLWGGTPAQTEFDTLLEKTTSDTLPSSTPVDLSLSLQLADLIRSASVPPPSSSKSLLKRLTHDNPNVQLLSLQVLDVCIKNGGTPFLVQISDKDKDFSTGLESLARTGSGVGSKKKEGNRDVREKTLEKLQEWAVAFKGKEQLRDTLLVRTYDRMKNEGLPFPAKDPLATAAMVDSLAAPEWQDSSYCTRCRTDFSTFNRKHHCRNCGQVFDAACSSQTSPLPHYGITQQVRVCDGCSKKIKEGKGATVARNQSVKSNDGSSSSGKGRGHARSKSRKDQEDDDLRKAIEASLKESSDSTSHGPLREAPPPKTSGYNPSYASNFSGTDSKKSNGRTEGEEEDSDLAAAIAASLRDIAPPPTAPTFNRRDSSQPVTYAEMFPPTSTSSSRPTYPSQDSSDTPRPRVSLPSYDLLPHQLSSLSQFTQTFTPQHPGPTYLRREEHDLAGEVVRDLRPRLERSLEDTRRRKEILKELEWKLGEAARLYGAGLTEQNQVYRSPRQQEPYHPQQPQYVHSDPHYAPPSTSIRQDTINPQYQYHPSASSSIVGQPLPNYALPPQPEPQHPQEYYQPPQAEYHQQQQQEVSLPTKTQEPVAAGYYKPSSFPSVPQMNPPSSLEALPHVPEQEPWRNEREEEKVGELIEF